MLGTNSIYCCDLPQSCLGRFNLLEGSFHFSFPLLFRELRFFLSGMRKLFIMGIFSRSVSSGIFFLLSMYYAIAPRMP